MKQLITLLFTVSTAFSTFAQTQKAEDVFKTASMVTFDTNVKPEQLIGALIYYKPGKKDEFEYFQILSTEQLKKYEPVYNNRIIFQSMVTKETVASAKYLAFFSTSVTVTHLLEVVLEDVLDYRVPNFATEPNVKTQTFMYAENLIRKGYQVDFVDNVNYCSLTTRLFNEAKISANGNYYVSADAKNYSSTSEFSTKRLISLHSINLNNLITIGGALAGSTLGGSIAKLNTAAITENSTTKPATSESGYLVAKTLKLGSIKTLTGEN